MPAMKPHYEPSIDAFYVRFAETPIEESEEVAPGIVLDFDAEHRLVAIEILNARSNLAAGALLSAAE
jgi:uncharacterized protein YuzE